MERKHIFSILILLVLIILTTMTILSGKDVMAVVSAIHGILPFWLLLIFAVSLFFVSAEGMIIYYLLRSMQMPARLFACISWSFIGYFFSGITPSSTGGQPVQVYYMKKAGIKISDSTPVLMVVAVLYKLVMIMIGLILLLFFWTKLAFFFGSYLWIFYLGLGLHILLVTVLVFIMYKPDLAQQIAAVVEKALVSLHILKESEERRSQITYAVNQYQQVICFFRNNKFKIIIALMMTFIQRCSTLVLVWLVYRGMGMNETGVLTFILLQAALYITVDMLPLPGSVGITELIYSVIYIGIFQAGEVMSASMLISRGANFYFTLIVSASIFGISVFLSRKRV